MQTFTIKKRQTITDDIPGDVIYELIARNEETFSFGTKYLTLTTEELKALTNLLIITTRK